MSYRKLFLPSATLLALSLSLMGCDPSKTTSPTPSGNAPKSTTTAPDSAGGSTASAIPEAFTKPRKAEGALLLKVITNGTDPFWDTMGKGLDVGIKEVSADPKSGWIAPKQTDNASQKSTFDQEVINSADGIAVSPIQADAFAPTIDAAIDKGIPVVTFDSDSPSSKRLAYIGTDNYQAGKAAGEAAVKLFPKGGKFVAFVGNMTADNAKQRYQGFLDAVKGHNIEMLAEPFEDDKDQAGRAHRNVADAITKFGDKINGFLGLYAYNGPAIVDEVTKKGIREKVKIVCFDGNARTLAFLKAGKVDVTVVQKPFEFGRLSAKLLTLINRKGVTEALTELKPELEAIGMKVDVEKRIIDTGVTIVTPENAAEFLKDLNAKGIKST